MSLLLMGAGSIGGAPAVAATASIILTDLAPDRKLITVGVHGFQFGSEIDIADSVFDEADSLASLINSVTEDTACTSSIPEGEPPYTLTLTAIVPGAAGNLIPLSTTVTDSSVTVVPFSGGLG